MSSDFIFSHIVAASQNHVIGFQNKLPWHIPEDLKFFHDKTKNHVVVMGRKTFESLGKPLPKRVNIIITQNPKFKRDFENTFVCTSLDQALLKAQEVSEKKEIFITGGGEIYKLSLPLVHRIYLTRIHQKYTGDSFYPEVPNDFKLIHQENRKGSPAFSFLTYERSLK